MSDTGAAPLDAVWLERLRRHLQQAPGAPRAPLVMVMPPGAPAVIGSIQPAIASRLAEAGLLRMGADACCIDAQNPIDADTRLAAVADWLRTNRLASAWRDELLAVVDADGRQVGAIERAVVRPLGIATHAVHLIVVAANGGVWVQQRAFDKAVDPGLWDTTMGGLMAAGESVTQTLARETWEEAGLRIDALSNVRPIGRITVRRPVDDGYMIEHIEAHGGTAAPGVVPVNQDGEVERFECLAPADLVQRLHADAFTLEAAAVLARWFAPAAEVSR